MALYNLPKNLHPDFAQPGRKPVGGVEIDWANKFADQLGWALLLRNNFYDDVTGQQFTGETGSRTFTFNGRRLVSTAGTGQGVKPWGTGTAALDTQPWALTFRCAPETITNYRTLLDGGADAPFLGIENSRFVFYNGINSTNPTLVSGQWYTVTFQHTSAGEEQIWIDGENRSQGTWDGQKNGTDLSLFAHTDPAWDGEVDFACFH